MNANSSRPGTEFILLSNALPLLGGVVQTARGLHHAWFGSRILQDQIDEKPNASAHTVVGSAVLIAGLVNLAAGLYQLVQSVPVAQAIFRSGLSVQTLSVYESPLLTIALVSAVGTILAELAFKTGEIAVRLQEMEQRPLSF